MGRKKTYVGTQVVRMMEDKNLPNYVKSGTLRSLLNKGNLADYLVETGINSLGIKAERYYQRAEQGKYIYGLPKSRLVSSNVGYSEVKSILENAEGTAVDIQYVKLGGLNCMHQAWQMIISMFQYDPTTNELVGLSAIKGRKVYLADMQIVLPTPRLEDYRTGVLAVWGAPPNAGELPFLETDSILATELINLRAFKQASPLLLDTSSPVEQVLITYAGLEEVTVQSSEHGPYKETKLTTETVTVPLPAVSDADKAADHFQACYEAQGVRKWVTYRKGSGAFPALDALTNNSQVVSAKFFPLVYFRFDKKDETADKSLEAYKSSKALLDTLDIPIDSVAKNIHENPDIKDVAQVFLMFGVPADSKDATEARYLIEFFAGVYASQGMSQAGSFSKLSDIRTQLGLTPTQTSQGNLLELEVGDSRFRMTLKARNLTRRSVGGQLGKVGTYKATLKEEYEEHILNESESGATTTVRIPYKVYVYQHQFTDSMYSEIKVLGLSMTYWVEGNHRTTSDSTKDILYIPLDKSITEKYSLATRELLYARSMQLVCNSLVVVKLKWYQTGLFKVFVIIISIVITWFYPPAGSAMAGLAAGTATVAAVVLEVLLTAIISMMVGVAIRMVAKAIGGPLAMLLAVIVMMYTGYTLMESGASFIPMAQDLMMIASNLIQGGMEAMYEGLAQDTAAFIDYAKKALETLGNAQDLLDSTNHLAPMLILGEPPTNFFHRTVHAGNIGTAAIDAISEFVSMTLRLPSFEDTLGRVGITGTRDEDTQQA